MKYTLMGFNQKQSLELGLDMTDLCLLRWFIDFQNTNKMKMHFFQTSNIPMYQVNYDAVIEAFPILGLNSNDAVYRRFIKLVKAGLLHHKTLRVGGTFAYYSITENTLNLMYDKKSDQSDENPNPTDEKSEGGTDEKSEQNNSSIKEDTNVSKKRISSEPSEVINNAKLELNKCFNRRDTTQWSEKEIKALKTLLKRNDFEQEMLLVTKLYKTDYKYKRRSLQTLLNNWTDALDVASNYFLIHKPVKPGGWDEKTRGAII